MASVVDPRDARAIAQGRAVLASGLARLATVVADYQMICDIVNCACDYPWIKLTAAIVASNIPDAVAWSLATVDARCQDDKSSCHHTHFNERWRARCALLTFATSADASTTVRIAIGAGCYDHCPLHAAREAA
jgi:hypothetical protein